MVYIIYGDQKFLVNRTLKKVEKEYNDIQKFNYLEDSYDDILKSISSFSLFSDKKMVEILNFKPLLMNDNELKKDKKVEQIIDSIIKCDHIDIYLIIYEASLVNNELYEYVEKNGKFIQNLSLSKNDWKIYASKKFEKVGVKISPDALEELISRCENDLNRFDIETSEAMRQVAEISAESMFKQLSLNDTDFAKIIKEQGKMIREMQYTMQTQEEELRLLKEKHLKEELLVEYERQLKDKGINSEEIAGLLEQELKYSPSNIGNTFYTAEELEQQAEE